MGKHHPSITLDHPSLAQHHIGLYPEPMGNAHFVHVPYNVFRTSTGHIIIACIGDAFFERLLEVIPRPELRVETYRKQPGRYAERDRINQIVQEVLLGNTAEFWLKKLQAARIPCGPVNNFKQALSDPQVVARNMIVDVHLQSGATVSMPGNPVKMSEAGEEAFAPPPLLGEQTDAVLKALLGYDAGRIASLKTAGVIR